MAICPDHGGYNGQEGCKKCNETVVAKEATKLADAKALTLVISTDDKLTFKQTENAALRAQVEVQGAMQKATQTQQQLNNFAQVLFEKHGIDVKEYVLNPETMEFQKRPSGPVSPI